MIQQSMIDQLILSHRHNLSVSFEKSKAYGGKSVKIEGVDQIFPSTRAADEYLKVPYNRVLRAINTNKRINGLKCEYVE